MLLKISLPKSEKVHRFGINRLAAPLLIQMPPLPVFKLPFTNNHPKKLIFILAAFQTKPAIAEKPLDLIFRLW